MKPFFAGPNLPEVKVTSAETSPISPNPRKTTPERVYVHNFRTLPEPRGYPALELPYRPQYLKQRYIRPDPPQH